MQYSVSMYLMAVIMEHNGSSLIFLNAHKPPPLSRSYVTTRWNPFGIEISHLWLLSSVSRDKFSVLIICQFEYKGFKHSEHSSWNFKTIQTWFDPIVYAMPLSVAFPYVEIPTVHFIHSNCIISLPYVYLPTYVRAKSLYVYNKSHAVIYIFLLEQPTIERVCLFEI